MAQHVQTVINGKVYWVDSHLEARMLTWLENNGFSGRWRRPEKGLNSGRWNYTPDIELFIQHEHQMHLALVEIKPVLHHHRYGFSKHIFERMRKVARVYFATMLLLYVEEDKTWYRINHKTGELTVFGVPIPAEETIDRAYKPLTVGARKIFHHEYKQRFDWYMFKAFAIVVADGLEGVVKHLTSPVRTHGSRGKRIPYRRRYRRYH